MNARNNETPRMISGSTNDSSIVKLAIPGPRPCHRSIPIANRVPSVTALSIVATASHTLWTTEARSSGRYSSDSAAVGSPTHHRRENPCHALRDRPALKEKATAMRTGTSDHARYPQVSAWRNRGFRHGSFHHRRTDSEAVLMLP